MYDTHIHTASSHDSNQTYDMICLSAIEKGLRAVSFADHIDLLIYSNERNMQTLSGTAESVKKAREIYGKSLEILTGAEIAMASLDKDKTEKYIKHIDADIVLGSVHSFMADGKKVRFSMDNLSKEAYTKEELYKLVELYYKNLLDISLNADIDVLCHLTYPLRYTNKKYGRDIDINAFSDIINNILQSIINRGIALELNTAYAKNDLSDLCPDTDIVKAYYNMGGRLITLGSDAHIPDKIGNCFEEVKKELKAIGFDYYVYYKKRKAVKVNL